MSSDQWFLARAASMNLQGAQVFMRFTAWKVFEQASFLSN